MKKRVLIIVGIVAAVIVVVCVALVASGTVIVFRHGVALASTENLSMDLEPEELPKLDTLTSLKHVTVKGNDSLDQINAWAVAHPDLAVDYEVDLPAGVSYDRATQVADLTSMDQAAAVDLARTTLHYASNVKGVKIDAPSWSPESLAAFREACPQIAMVGSYQAGSINVALDATDVDLTQATVEELETFAPLVGGMTNVKSINLGEEEGHTKLHAASVMKQSNPNVAVNYTFGAFGKRINLNDTTLDFRRCPMTDGGTEVRDIMNNMPWVTFLDLDTCGLDDETCASIRNDYPNTEVVWRIWFGGGIYTVRTDTQRIFASNEGLGSLSPENDQALKYCNKVKYLDLGHNSDLQDIWFVSYMPDLEVFICILGNITDISPLADCPHLEFLEIFSNYVTDLSPLANCHELKHLNASNNPGISDITCLYDIDLERFWCGYPNSVPEEQFARYQELHPNCVVRTMLSNPHEDYRWGNPRYELLRKQIGYDNLDFSTPENDPLWEGPIDIPVQEETGDQTQETGSQTEESQDYGTVEDYSYDDSYDSTTYDSNSYGDYSYGEEIY
ncbi:MAG: leucine-rich repeat domain-containing protein [Atopobiaceae bacterium]|nr:leucine-rich repeat domain-containing protein [Atopobiaceae bacterium]